MLGSISGARIEGAPSTGDALQGTVPPQRLQARQAELPRAFPAVLDVARDEPGPGPSRMPTRVGRRCCSARMIPGDRLGSSTYSTALGSAGRKPRSRLWVEPPKEAHQDD